MINYYSNMFTKRILVFCFIILSVFKINAQNITNADGTPFRTAYCHSDSSFQIIGTPGGGTFSGCGVTNQGGNWYFSPETATVGISVWPFQCTLTYTSGSTVVTKYVIVYPPVQLTSVIDSVTCDGTVVLNGASVIAGAVNFRWSPAQYVEKPDSMQTRAFITQDQVFTLSAIDINSGCSDSASYKILYKKVNADISVNKDTICTLDPLMATAIAADDVNMFWWQTEGVQNVTTPDFQHVYDKTGTYQVTLIASNGFYSNTRDGVHVGYANRIMCADTVVKNIEVVEFNIELASSMPIVKWQQPVTLTTKGNYGYTTYAWTPSGLFTDPALSEQVVKLDTTTTITVYGSSIHGCKDSADVRVIVQPTVSLPTVFSPNGDGKNDVFRFILSKGQIPDVNFIRIYNRWGKEVWASAGANAFAGWDGTINGEPAEIDTYFYQLEFVEANGNVVNQKGDFTLVR